MTTFEITIITILALIAFALIFRDFVIGKALDQIIKNQESQYKKLDFINTQTAGIWRGQDQIDQAFTDMMLKGGNDESKN